MGGRKPALPRGLCAYLVDIKECDGVTTVPEEAAFLVKKCILDKIFSENPDNIAICRSDKTSQVKFVPANWEGLKKGLDVLEENRSCEDGDVINPVSSLDDVVNAVIVYAEEDTYEEKKIIYFANLSSYVLEEKQVTKLAEKLLKNDIFISMILPNKVDMTELQAQNAKLLRKVFNQGAYEDVSLVTTMEKAHRQILNTQTKKYTRPSPWNVLLEITPEIQINVGGYSSTRKNTSASIGMSRVLLKESDNSTNSMSTTNSDGHSSTSETRNSSDQIQSEHSNNEKTVVVEAAKSVVEKERIWTEHDGTQVSEEDIGKAYYFGDKLVPYNELEHEGSYHSGPKCLKLLAFCPKEKISSPFIIGDGITLFYPKKDDKRPDVESEVKFKALLKAMINTERIAIVRRVYRSGSRVTVGTLVPDEERQCLIFSEICFADDVSIPQFPYLIKPEEIGDEEDNLEVSEKEALIDELIKAKSLESFHPTEGPCDPAIKVMREKVARKIVKDSALDIECQNLDNIDIIFQGLFVDSEETLAEKIRDNFPLKENKTDNERLAGSNVFRKRAGDEMPELESAKKPKAEEGLVKEDAKIEVDENPDELDDLLDEL